MALIQCPACGKTISENASTCPSCGEPISSKMSAVVDSGTESFFVQGKNRIELSAKAQAEISARTNRLSSEGKTVVNVNKSDPQPFSLGVTIWQMDITIIWNASLASPTYKDWLYSQAKQLYQSNQYTKALDILGKLNGYSDSAALANRCRESIDLQQKARIRASIAAAETRRAVGDDASKTGTGIFRYILGGISLFISFILIVSGGCSYEGPLNPGYKGEIDPSNRSMFVTGLVFLGIGIVFIIWNRILHKRYETKVAHYKYSKH